MLRFRLLLHQIWWLAGVGLMRASHSTMVSSQYVTANGLHRSVLDRSHAVISIDVSATGQFGRRAILQIVWHDTAFRHRAGSRM